MTNAITTQNRATVAFVLARVAMKLFTDSCDAKHAERYDIGRMYSKDHNDVIELRRVVLECGNGTRLVQKLDTLIVQMIRDETTRDEENVVEAHLGIYS